MLEGKRVTPTPRIDKEFSYEMEWGEVDVSHHEYTSRSCIIAHNHGTDLTPDRRTRTEKKKI